MYLLLRNEGYGRLNKKVLLEALEHGFVRMKQLALMVFDEVMSWTEVLYYMISY